jgi:hypothetical protein
LIWGTILSLAFSASFPGGSLPLVDEPVDLTAFLPFVAAARDHDGAAARDDATALRHAKRKSRCPHVAPAIASGSFTGSPCGAVVPPSAVGIAPVVCKCLLGWTDWWPAALGAALRSVSEGVRAGTLRVSPAVATDVQFLS